MLSTFWGGEMEPTEAQVTVPASLPPITWQRQVVDPRGYSGQFSDLVLDADGYPHIAYSRSEGVSSILFYMRWDGVTWQKERVDNTIPVGNEVSIMLDAQQRPHIAYQDSVNQDLYYAFRDESGWHSARLVHLGVVGRFNNIALTNLGVAITYFDETQGEIDILFGAVGSLTFGLPQRVAQTATLGQHGLAVNSQGRPRVSYHDSVNGDLMLASQQISGAWTSETVGDMGNVGVTSSLAYDSNDVPHIAASVFYENRYFLNYYTFNGSTWQDEGVAANVNLSVGQYHDLTVDDNGRATIAYIDSTNRSLKLARRESLFNWQTETIDTTNVTRVGGIGVDAAGEPIVSYYESDYGDLVVSSGGSDWQTRIVYDNNAQPNYLPSLALNGHSPAVTFHTKATQPNSTQLAGWDGTAWADDLVTLGADATVSSPLVYDGNGRSHAAYYQPATHQIMFAMLVNNVWEEVPAVTLPAGTSIGPDLNLMLVGLEEYPTLAFSAYNVTNGATLMLAQAVAGVWSQSSLPVVGQSAPLAPLSADYHYGGGMSIVYFNSVDNTLNEAFYDGTWQETVVANGVQVTAVSTTVSRRRLSNGDPTNTPTITYYDANANEIVYARLEDVSTWIPRVVATPSSPVESLATVFIGNATTRPRIAAITVDNAVRLFGADGENFAWVEESVVAGGTAVRSHVNLAFGDRERLSYLEDGVVMHAFRTATTLAPVSPVEDSSAFGGLQNGNCVCLIVACWGPFTWGMLRVDDAAALQETAHLNNDGSVMNDLTRLFLATPEGSAFVDIYLTHDYELALILINDPLLGWDSFRTLENWMPGLTAFTQGHGDEVVIDQALVDQSLAMWQQVKVKASPALTAVINHYLTDTNNLQDYVGLTFDEWAATLGVNPPTPFQVFLPLVTRQ